MGTLTAPITGPICWDEWSHDPYPLYRQLRDHAPAFVDEPNGMVLLTRYDDVFAALTSPARFSNVVEATVPADERMSPLREQDPPRHTFLRGLVMPLFSPRVMKRREAYFATVVEELLDRVDEHDTIDASPQLAVPLPGRVTCDLLGLPLDRHELFLALTAERLHALRTSSGRADLRGDERTVAEIREDLWEVIEPVAAARRRQPQDDAITVLFAAQEAHGRDELPDDLIVDMLLHLLTGGFHTTQHLVEMLVDLFADRPDLWERLDADRTLIPLAIEEMLRFEAPSQALRRRARESMTIHGVDVAAGTTLAVVYGSANRDERVFADPDTYSLDRGPGRHMAFSAGIHYCPGAPTARAEVVALLNAMLDRYAGIERVAPSVREPPPQRTVEALRGLASVPVRLVGRSGSRPNGWSYVS